MSQRVARDAEVKIVFNDATSVSICKDFGTVSSNIANCSAAERESPPIEGQSGVEFKRRISPESLPAKVVLLWLRQHRIQTEIDAGRGQEMHCKSCGATLEAIDHFGNLACKFCGTLHPAKRSEGSNESIRSIDGVQFLAKEAGDSCCPRCDVTLSIGLLDGAKVAACKSCHGALMDRADFARIIRQRRASYRGSDAQVTPMDATQLHVSAKCPGCAAEMETFPYYGPGAVVIDLCESCDLLWSDSGEVARIESAPGVR